MSFPHGRTITVIRQTKGRGGDPSGNPVTFDIAGCAVWPTGAGSEDTAARNDQVTSQVTVLAPEGSDIRPTDRIRLDGVTYDVDGRPEAWANPFTGWSPGLEVILTRWEG